jgi:hypothetical protein
MWRVSQHELTTAQPRRCLSRVPATHAVHSATCGLKGCAMPRAWPPLGVTGVADGPLAGLHQL